MLLLCTYPVCLLHSGVPGNKPGVTLGGLVEDGKYENEKEMHENVVLQNSPSRQYQHGCKIELYLEPHHNAKRSRVVVKENRQVNPVVGEHMYNTKFLKSNYGFPKIIIHSIEWYL